MPEDNRLKTHRERICSVLLDSLRPVCNSCQLPGNPLKETIQKLKPRYIGRIEVELFNLIGFLYPTTLSEREKLAAFSQEPDTKKIAWNMNVKDGKRVIEELSPVLKLICVQGRRFSISRSNLVSVYGCSPSWVAKHCGDHNFSKYNVLDHLLLRELHGHSWLMS